MELTKTIKKLESIYLEKPERVFTMYLNTDPSDPDQQGGEWRIHLKNGLNNFKKYLKTEDSEDELNNFKKVIEQVNNFFNEYELDLQKSVIIFATPTDGLVFAEILQVPVETEFFWEEIAKVDQLIRLHQEYPRVGVILTQKEAIQVVVTELGKCIDTVNYELDLDTEDWRKHPSVNRNHTTMGGSGKSVNIREQFLARFEANRHRWYKSIAPDLDKLAKEDGLEYIYMMGDPEETKDLAKAMNKDIHTFIDKNMLDEKPDKIIKEVHKV